MALYELDDVFGYQDANDIKRLWAAADDPDPQTTELDIGEVYLNVSTTPCQLKRYNGSDWEIIGVAATQDIAGTDLNDLAVTGFYKGNNFSNSPDGSANAFSVLNLQHSATEKTQVAWSLDSNTVNAQYMRNMAGGTWGSWAKVWTGTVDGSGSGLDADTLDGAHGSQYARSDVDTVFQGEVRILTGEGLSIADGGDWASTPSLGGHTPNDVRLIRIEDANSSVADGALVIGSYGPVGSSPTFVELLYIQNSSFEWQGNKIYHAGNDGSGSGLDADKVDGLEAASFVRTDADSSSSGILTSTITTGPVIKFDNGESMITVHDGYGNFNIKSGVDETNTIISGNGGCHIEMSHTGTLTIAVSTQTEGTAFNDDVYIQLNSSGVIINGNTVWHAGNDGAGSGLDADTIDGVESSTLVQTSGTQTIAGTKTFTGKVTLNFPVIPLSKPSGAVNGTIWIA